MRVTAIGGSRDQIPQQHTTTLRHIVRPQPLDTKLNINFSRCASDRCLAVAFWHHHLKTCSVEIYRKIVHINTDWYVVEINSLLSWLMRVHSLNLSLCFYKSHCLLPQVDFCFYRIIYLWHSVVVRSTTLSSCLDSDCCSCLLTPSLKLIQRSNWKPVKAQNLVH